MKLIKKLIVSFLSIVMWKKEHVTCRLTTDSCIYRGTSRGRLLIQDKNTGCTSTSNVHGSIVDMTLYRGIIYI